MYTYVFAYYLRYLVQLPSSLVRWFLFGFKLLPTSICVCCRKNNQSAIFEDNQKDLESATEQLSEYLERDISAENLVDIKQKVGGAGCWVVDYDLVPGRISPVVTACPGAGQVPLLRQPEEGAARPRARGLR